MRELRFDINLVINLSLINGTNLIFSWSIDTKYHK